MSSPDQPYSFSVLGQASVALHEMFLSFADAGFTEAEALELVKASLVEAIRLSVSPPKPV